MSSKPVRAYVAFQSSDRLAHTDQTTNSLIFDNVNLEHIHMRLNGKQVPDLQYEPDFTPLTDDYVREFTSLIQMNDKQVFDSQAGGSINYADYKTLYPIFAFDFSAQDASLFERGSTADVEVRWKTRTTPAKDYHVVVVLQSEAALEFHPIAENRVRVVQV